MVSVKVLFVCLGNICRSPTAHGLFQAQVDKSDLSEKIVVSSAGTGHWHVGDPPDKRAQATARDFGYDISHLRARQVTASDFDDFTYVLGMDKQNMQNLQSVAPSQYTAELGLFLEFTGIGHGLEVPDPYYGGDSHFKEAIELIDRGCKSLLDIIREKHGL